MKALLVMARRTAWHRDTVVLLAVAAASSGLLVSLAEQALGAGPGALGQVRHGGLLFVAVLALSLAEPLQVQGEARSGLLLLRHARGAGFALVPRWLGVVAGLVPVLTVAAVASGGLPARPGMLGVELLVLAAAGLLLGAYLPRPLLVAALWVLVLAGHLRPWIVASPVGAVAGLVLPDLGSPGGMGALHGALWCGAALLLTHRRLERVCARGGAVVAAP